MDESNKPKKKRKKLSCTAKLKKEKEQIKYYRDLSWNRWSEIRELKNELREIEYYIKKQYYKISFKMKGRSDNIVSAVEIHKGYTLDDAIRVLKKNKLHPDTFELVDVKVLG